ncbi:unnamed protein product [Rhizoctonia solani]|uniref:Uncharacterized protein n=1 Tax=Rhizoctonia solani TaxID=456999 RepID=A0A8H3GRG1_9AGAM|nr:unnamed protein product [Rhizoctonia solani]
MTIPPDQFHLPPTIDRNALASAIALASNALAAAGEALAEASKAMSDAGQVDRIGAPSGIDSGFSSRSRPPDIAETKGKHMSSDIDRTHELGLVDRPNEPGFNEATGAQPDNNPSTPTRATYPEWNLSNDSDIIPATNSPIKDRTSMLLSLDYEHAKPDSESETCAEANNQNWHGQADQYGQDDQQDPAQYEQGIFFTVPPPAPPAESSGGMEPIPLLGPSGWQIDSQSPQYQMGDAKSKKHGSLKDKLKNKRNASLPTSAGMTSNIHEDPPTSLGEQRLHVDSHSRKYIRLAKPSDAISFIAFIAQQPGRILCVTPDEAIARSSSSDVEDLKTVSVYRVYTTKLVEPTRRKLQSCPEAVPPIGVFIPANIFGSSPNKNFSADSVLYWGPPPKAQQYIAQSLSFSPPPRLSCVMVIGNQQFNESAYGASAYSASVLNTFSKFSVELRSRQLRQIPPTPVSIKRPAGSTVNDSTRYYNPARLVPSVASTSWVPPRPTIPPIARRVQQPYPQGHYYIVLDPPQNLSGEMRDQDIIPLVAFIALNSTRVICCIPSDKDLLTYQRLINSIANVDATIPASIKEGQIRVACKQLARKQSGVLFGPCSTAASHAAWKAGWRKSYAECLIYCGMPPDLGDYLKECQIKVSHSYIVLTSSQFMASQWQLAAAPQLRHHPYIRPSESLISGNLLHDLRERLVPYLC